MEDPDISKIYAESWEITHWSDDEVPAVTWYCAVAEIEGRVAAKSVFEVDGRPDEVDSGWFSSEEGAIEWAEKEASLLEARERRMKGEMR